MFVSVALFVIAVVLVGLLDRRRETKYRTVESAEHEQVGDALTLQPGTRCDAVYRGPESAQRQDAIYKRAA